MKTKRFVQKHRCYYFSDSGTSWFEVDSNLQLKWNALCRRLFTQGLRPTRQDYINFINRNHEI